MDSSTLHEVLDYLCRELGGEWLLMGGALVLLNFDSSRGTEDIDLVRMNHPELSDTAAKNTLYKWLIKKGLGPEWVNSAVEPFIREIQEWETEVVPLQTGARGKVYRPTLTVFVYLKLRRGTEIDLMDIKKAVPKCPEGFDEKKFMKWADDATKKKFTKLRANLGI